MRFSISENKTSEEIQCSSGTEHLKLESIGIGPDLSVSENHLQIISDVLFRSINKLSLLPEYDGNFFSFLLIGSKVILKIILN